MRAQRGQKGGRLAKRGGAKVKSVKARRQDTEKTHSEATGWGRRIWGGDRGVTPSRPGGKPAPKLDRNRPTHPENLWLGEEEQGKKSEGSNHTGQKGGPW